MRPIRGIGKSENEESHEIQGNPTESQEIQGNTPHTHIHTHSPIHIPKDIDIGLGQEVCISDFGGFHSKHFYIPPCFSEREAGTISTSSSEFVDLCGLGSLHRALVGGDARGFLCC